MNSLKKSLLVALTLINVATFAQPGELIDKVIGIVGDETALYSDLQKKILQASQGGMIMDQKAECFLLEEVLYEDLLLHYAKTDSVEVGEDQVEGELSRRVEWFSMQMGGMDKVEEFYGKTINEIKEEFRAEIRDQMLIRSMQSTITENLNVIPADVEEYFARIPEDSLPFINSEVEFAHIVRKPPISAAEKKRVRKRLEGFREDIVTGKKQFCVLAELYSQDPGSKDNCGELGLVPKGVMVPKFDAVALGLQEGEVSQVFETDFGFHLMELLEKRGEQYNARHILIQPVIGPDDLLKSKHFLDDLRTRILKDSISFAKAAIEFSQDDESKNNNGLVLDPNTNSTKFDMSAVDPQVFFSIDKMKVGDVSEPVIMQNQDGTRSYRLIKLISRSEPHVADLTRDWQLINNAASNIKRSEMINNWVGRKVKGTYVRLDEKYLTCSFDHDWVKASEKNSH